MDRMLLIGADDVRAAGHEMSRAAADMCRAASEISYSLQNAVQRMQDLHNMTLPVLVELPVGGDRFVLVNPKCVAVLSPNTPDRTWLSLINDPEAIVVTMPIQAVKERLGL